jgi:hypothetical protein
MILQDVHLTPQRQASIYAQGLLILLALGTLTAIGLCIAALWLLVEVIQLLLTAIVEACTTIGATFQAADPLVKFLLLVAIGFVLYRAGQHFLRRTSR